MITMTSVMSLPEIPVTAGEIGHKAFSWRDAEVDPMPVADNYETAIEGEGAEELSAKNPLILLHLTDINGEAFVKFRDEKKDATSQKAKENKAWLDELPTFEESERWNEERGAYMGPLLHDYNPERDYPAILPAMKEILSLGKNGAIDRARFTSIGIRDCDLFAEGNIRNDGENIHVEQEGVGRMFLGRDVEHYRSIVKGLSQKYGLDGFILGNKLDTRERLGRIYDILGDKRTHFCGTEGELFDIFEYKRLKKNKGRYFWVPKDHVDNNNPHLWNDDWEISSRDGKFVWQSMEKLFKAKGIIQGPTGDRVIEGDLEKFRECLSESWMTLVPNDTVSNVRV